MQNAELQTQQTRVQFHAALRPERSVTLNRNRAGHIVKFRRKDLERLANANTVQGVDFISIFRSQRYLASPDRSIATSTSPWLACTAALLATLWTILEIDLHRAELQLLGLLGDGDEIDPIFLGLRSPCPPVPNCILVRFERLKFRRRAIERKTKLQQSRAGSRPQ